MRRVRVIPVLLIKGRGLYKTIKFSSPIYLGDPVNAVKIFNDKEVDEIVILDIDASINNIQPNYKLISDISSECFMPLTYGGGITNEEQAVKIFNLGVEKIIINSHFHSNPSLVTKITDKYGSQSTVVSIDYKKSLTGKNNVYTHGGSVNTHINPVDYATMATKAGAGEILLNNMNNDGMRTGYDSQTIRQVTTAVNVPVIACGGACGMEDIFKVIMQGNASAAAAGSMFVYIGKSTDSILINYPSANDLNNLYERL